MMLKSALALVICAALTAGGLAAPTASAAPKTVKWLLVSDTDTLPAGLATKVAQAGGTVTASFDFGVAVVEAPASFAGVAGTTAVVDAGFTFAEEPAAAVAETPALPPSSGDDDFFFDLQWGHVATRSVQAWQDGVRGQGVRVAVLDTAFDVTHPDLTPNINVALSTDFTGDGLATTAEYSVDHGTHVAGVIAAADNAYGTIGIAPDAELVLERVIGNDGVGQWSDIIAAITYAASPAVDADIINMSLGETLTRRGSEAARLILAVNRAVRWAVNQGTTVVVSAGNEARNLDRSGTQVRLPASSPQAIAVAATAPLGWLIDPGKADFTVPASTYTNFGRSTIGFSAPGGDVQWTLDPANDPTQLCVAAGVPAPCGVFDLVFSTTDGGSWNWSAGTSQAAAHASGVAALIISELGGDLTPAQVERELRRRAIDAGQRGRDPFHGRGFVTSGH